MSGTRSSPVPKPGDILLVSFPFTDLRSTKRRPAVVLSPASFHRKSDDFIVCCMTSHVRGTTEEVRIDSRDLACGTLPAPSVALVSKIATLHKGLVTKRLGSLGNDKLAEVRSRLGRSLRLR